jgi:chromatin segregation and condensation protein Rec8/ScpA/Scc1 (kleisin family)
MPIRFEYTATSISQVLSALDEVLKSERLALLEKKPILSPPAILEHLDEFMMNIEERIEEYYTSLVKKAKRNRPISFLNLAKKKPLLEVVRDFIILLFLAIQGRVALQQDQEFGDIQIRIRMVKPSLAA